jgi:hypothetical protein
VVTVHLKISREWARALVALLLACLLAPSTAVQSHIHFASPPLSAAKLTGGSACQPTKADKDGKNSDCLLCQQKAIAGAYLLPRAIALPAPLALALWIAAAALREFSLAAPAHGWLSRAPPQ